MVHDPHAPAPNLLMLPIVTVTDRSMIEAIRAGASRAGRGSRVIVVIGARPEALLAALATRAEVVIAEVEAAEHVGALAGIRASGGQGFPTLEMRAIEGAPHLSLAALALLGDERLHDLNVPVPAIADEGARQVLWDELRAARVEERHHLVEVDGAPALAELRARGRPMVGDAWTLLAAGAAGVLAGRLSASNRRWRAQLDD